MRRLMNGVGFGFAIGIALTACGGGGSNGSDGSNSLVTTTAEPVGPNCAAGGQRLLIGLDKNDDNKLQDSEAQYTTFACNGLSAKAHLDVTTIAPGDSRCPDGGNLVSIADDSAAGVKVLAVCTGATGPTGAAGPAGPAGAVGTAGLDGAVGPAGPAGADGVAGATGPAGPAGETGPTGATGPAGATGATGATGTTGATGQTGATGPAGSEPLPLGQFLATQIVKGAILTCTSVSLTSANATCGGMKLNGLDIVFAFDSWQGVCAAITGKAPNSAINGAAASDPHYVWNGSAWAGEAGSAVDSTVTLSCTL